MDDDDVTGFEDYIPTTRDPGSWPLLFTVGYCVTLISLFPLFVAFRQWLKRKRDASKKAKEASAASEGVPCQRPTSANGLTTPPSVKDWSKPPCVESMYLKVDDDSPPSFANSYVVSHSAGSLVMSNATPSVSPASRRHSVKSVLQRIPVRWLTRRLRFGKALTIPVEDGEAERQTVLVVQMDDQHGLVVTENNQIVDHNEIICKKSYDTEDTQSSSESDVDFMATLVDELVEDVKYYDNDVQLYDSDDYENFDTVENTEEATSPDPVEGKNKYEIDLCCGTRPFFCYFLSRGFLRKVLKCAKWDGEMRNILKLATPFTLYAVAGKACNLLEVVLISQRLGTAALTAFFAVEFMITLGTMVIHGAMSSLSVLCSQAIGADNRTLAGRYVQISVLLHQIFVIPVIILGWNRFDDVVVWLGFDEETGQAALRYARIEFIVEAVSVYDSGLHYLLEVTGKENYSSIANGAKSICYIVIFFLAMQFHPNPELWMVGAVDAFVKTLSFIVNLAVILWNQWLAGYWQGMVGSLCIMDHRAVFTFVKMALPLSLGYVIEYCEWEVLFIFASVQGPAEVAVWGLLGSIWDVSENIGVAVADAAEIRVAKLLGQGKPAEARYSSHKAIFLGSVMSLLMSLLILSLAKYLPGWMTPDETLQDMLRELLPQMCLGLAVLTFGTMSWSVLCAQGRSSIAAVMCLIGSVGITLPFAVISTFVLNLNLHGLLASVILGYATSGVLISFAMVNTNWKKLAGKVNKKNKKDRKRKAAKVVLGGDGREAALLQDEGSTSSESDSASLDYNDYDWDELPEDVRTSAAALGYTEYIWDNDLEVEGLDVDSAMILLAKCRGTVV